MGPNKLTDAQYMQKADSLLMVLKQLDQPLDTMDTKWIDAQLDTVSNETEPSCLTYEQTMKSAIKAIKAQKTRAARRRIVLRTVAVAASLILAAAGAFSAASAFQWQSFLRIFASHNGLLSFQTPVKEDGSVGHLPKSGVKDAYQQNKTAEEPLYYEDITINSAQELLSLSTPGDRAFPILLDGYTFQSGTLDRNEFDNILTVTLADGNDASITFQIVTYTVTDMNNIASSIFFEIDEGSEKTLRIGDYAVIACTSGEYNTLQWIVEKGYCHLWGKTSHQDLLPIAEVLINAGLKPV